MSEYKRTLSTDLKLLESGLAGYMIRVAMNDSCNDELLQKVSDAIKMAEEQENMIKMFKIWRKYEN